MEESLHCDKCGEERIITDAITGMVVCDSCGFVKEDVVYTSAWDFATAEGGGNFVSATDTGARAASRFSNRVNGRWTHSTSAFSYHDTKTAIAMKKLDEITSQLRLPSQRVDDVKYMVEKITQGQLGLGRWFDILVGACVYVTVRQHHLPLTIIEVAVVINCDASELGRMYNRVLHFLDLKLPDVDLFIFLERAITTFPLFSDVGIEKTNKMMKHGRFLLQCAFQWFLTTGRHSLPIVAAILAFIAEVNEVNVGLEDLSKEMNVPVHTCKLRFKELQESLVRVGQSLPWGKDITTKTVIRHAPFLLQYLEIKANSKSKGKGNNAKIKENSEKDRIETGRPVLLPFKIGTTTIGSSRTSNSIPVEKTLRFSEEQAQSGLHDDTTGNPPVDEQHLEPFLDISGTSNETLIGHQQLGVCLEDAPESKISAKCLANIYDQFLQELPLTRTKVLTSEEDKKKRQQKVIGQKQRCDDNALANYPGNSALPQEKISMQQLLNEQEESDALPPSFVASLIASARRREKINAAKFRITEIKKSMCKYFLKDNTGQKYGEQLKDDLRQSGVLQLLSKKRKRQLGNSGLDWEDYIIECLLLHEADEKQIEDGHYGALLDLHVFKSDEIISDKELQQYFRSKGEVALMSMLQENGDAYPWISMAGL